MPIITLRFRQRPEMARSAIAIAVPSAASAREAEAKTMLKAMTDYMTAQKDLAFRYDASIDVVTIDGERLQIAYSGRVAIEVAGRAAVPGFVGLIASAHVGRPLTPVSVAGVARRTSRRCAAGVYDC